MTQSCLFVWYGEYITDLSSSVIRNWERNLNFRFFINIVHLNVWDSFICGVEFWSMNLRHISLPEYQPLGHIIIDVDLDSLDIGWCFLHIQSADIFWLHGIWAHIRSLLAFIIIEQFRSFSALSQACVTASYDKVTVNSRACHSTIFSDNISVLPVKYLFSVRSLGDGNPNTSSFHFL